MFERSTVPQERKELRLKYEEFNLVFRIHLIFDSIGPRIMKKEVLIAIALGLIVGLVITVGMYRARTAVQTAIPGSTFEPVQVPSTQAPTVLDATPLEALRILEPNDEFLATEESLRISGTTYANIALAVLHNDKEYVTKTDSQGNFSLTIKLDNGSNIFKIRALPQNQDPLEVIRTVVYMNTTSVSASSSAVPR